MTRGIVISETAMSLIETVIITAVVGSLIVGIIKLVELLGGVL